MQSYIIEADSAGRLRDVELRRRLADMAGTNLDQLEALAALRVAAKTVHDAMERWTESHGLSESRLRFLMALYFGPERHRPLRELADLLGVVPRTITDIADTLERDGLIARVPDPVDRRSIHARLTDTGAERVDELKRDAIGKQAAILEGFTTEQLAELRHLCLLLVERLRQQGDS